MMNISRLDPISLKHVANVESAPFIVEGEGACGLKIYFESESNRLAYLSLPIQEVTLAGYDIPVKRAVNE